MNLRKDNEGVSPVIGVILMVAITVVLAAVVFILVGNINAGTEYPVAIGISRDDGTFTITTVDDEIAYSDLIIKDNGVAQTYTVNGVAASMLQIMEPGDVIVVAGMTTGSHSVSFVYENRVIYSSSFSL
jgi:flagellin-like protein